MTIDAFAEKLSRKRQRQDALVGQRVELMVLEAGRGLRNTILGKFFSTASLSTGGAFNQAEQVMDFVNFQQ